MDDSRPTPSPISSQITEAQLAGESLLAACRAGDADAWQRLVEKYERLVYSIPLRMGLDRDEAADVFQLTFAALIQSLDAIRDESKLGGWLATVARRQSWAVLRRRRAEITFADVAPQDDPSLAERARTLGMANTDQIQSWELALWLDQGLAKLTDKCRELLTALYLDVSEPSYAELAERLGIPIGSIGPTRARCLERLRGILQER
ncbi:MAG: sigma-70 family RNA polymerase sigma factor [Anaerolineae bacterium]|nr:sigma-70 family RNA polymerase sigma factor [Candidatus Roseilinea sp.]MDW8449270.1 sigma-70 family RNA polymerase sigma factor [Anaerolineae bacterium]